MDSSVTKNNKVQGWHHWFRSQQMAKTHAGIMGVSKESNNSSLFGDSMNQKLQSKGLILGLPNYTYTRKLSMLKRIIVGTLAVASIAAIQVHAEALNNQKVPSVMKKIDEIQKNDIDLKGELPGLDISISNATKKAGLWKGELEGRITTAIKDYTVRANHSIAEEKRLTREILRHKSVCNGDLPRPVYNKCIRENGVLKQARTNHIKVRNDLIAEKKVNDAEWAKYAKLYNDEQATITSGKNRQALIKSTLVRHKQDLINYRRLLVQICSRAQQLDDDEALHHCNSIKWDGTRKTLPPLKQILRGTEFFGR